MKVYIQSLPYSCGPSSFFNYLLNKKPKIFRKLIEFYNGDKEKMEKEFHEVGRIKPRMVSVSSSFVEYVKLLKRKFGEDIALVAYSTGKISEDLKIIMAFFEYHGLNGSKTKVNWREIGKMLIKNPNIEEKMKEFEINFQKKIKENGVNIVSEEKIIDITRNSASFSLLKILWLGNIPVPHWVTIIKENGKVFLLDPDFEFGGIKEVSQREIEGMIKEIYKIFQLAEVVVYE